MGKCKCIHIFFSLVIETGNNKQKHGFLPTNSFFNLFIVPLWFFLTHRFHLRISWYPCLSLWWTAGWGQLKKIKWLWLWCLTPLSTIFQLYCGGQFIILMVEESGVTGENHRHDTSHRQTFITNVILSKPRPSRIWTYNVSGDKLWLHK
jgi:hypothetical protein